MIARGDAAWITISMRNKSARLEVSWSSLRRRDSRGQGIFRIYFLPLLSFPQKNAFCLVNGRFRTTLLKICDSIRSDFSETLKNRQFWHEKTLSTIIYGTDLTWFTTGRLPFHQILAIRQYTFAPHVTLWFLITCRLFVRKNSLIFVQPPRTSFQLALVDCTILLWTWFLHIRKCSIYKYMCIFL